LKVNGIGLALLYAPTRIRAVPVDTDDANKYGAVTAVPFANKICCNPEFIRMLLNGGNTFIAPLNLASPATARVLAVMELVPIAGTKSEFATAKVLAVMELVPIAGTKSDLAKRVLAVMELVMRIGV
jgi:hypothetical protein